ncbi:unnamed protein product [Urochloa humidicola]
MARRCRSSFVGGRLVSDAEEVHLGTRAIIPAPIRVREDQPPPSWDPITSPRVDMVGMGSPRLRRYIELRNKQLEEEKEQ